MTNEQLYLAIGVPILFNAGLMGILMLYINAKFEAAHHKTMAEFANLRSEIKLDFIEMKVRVKGLEDRAGVVYRP